MNLQQDRSRSKRQISKENKAPCGWVYCAQDKKYQNYQKMNGQQPKLHLAVDHASLRVIGMNQYVDGFTNLVITPFLAQLIRATRLYPSGADRNWDVVIHRTLFVALLPTPPDLLNYTRSHRSTTAACDVPTNRRGRSRSGSCVGCGVQSVRDKSSINRFRTNFTERRCPLASD